MLLTILRQTKAKIENPENWCQVYDAQTRTGGPTVSTDPEAVKFCTYGAYRSCLPNVLSPAKREFSDMIGKSLAVAAQELFQVGFYTVNDSMGHSQVMQVFDRAIENASIPQSD